VATGGTGAFAGVPAGAGGNPRGSGGVAAAAGNSAGGKATGGLAGQGVDTGGAGASNQGGAGSPAGMGGMAGGLVCPMSPPTSAAYSVDLHGLTLTLSTGLVRLDVCQDDIIRIQYTTASSLPDKTSLSVNASWGTPAFCVSEDAGVVTVTTTRLKAEVSVSSGAITYTDPDGAVILAEDSKSLTAATVEGVSTSKVQSVFASPSNEALFGLGQHQDSAMNLKGVQQHLENANTQINLPLLVSNRGYGVFWDNYSKSDFYGNDSNGTKYRYVSEAGDRLDYYFFYGPSLDRVIALYRVATGAAPMFPRWAYGLFQSKDHYQSTSELMAVKDGYRNAKIPLDVVVQDWDYWVPYVWGSHLMDESRYADPAALVSQMHDANVHLMISIWPLYETTASPRRTDELANFEALDALGALLPTSGTHHFYDPFNSMARALVYEQIRDRLLDKYGWDAIWADNTEPQAYPDPVNVHSATTALGKGALVLNAYPLEHARGLYEGWRGATGGIPDKRVYVLSRSAFSGQQRYGTACWSGDINCDFPTFAKQLPAGLNYALAGMPYWTTDIGGYFGGSVNWSSAASNELFTRWFQFGAFCPVFRIHGQGARELYNNVWSAETKANLLAVDKLRYRLMPYIYSLAWKVTSQGYTMMRHLVFDYPNDEKVFDIKDQFMFGPALLVNPVTAAGVTSRSVYLPAGTWYDFWTGATATGGASMTVNAPLSTIPLYVRGGSILPMGPNIEYAAQSSDPLEIRIYPGQDGSFTLYEDAGDTYDYETGQYAEIPLAWNEASRTLTIGARSGSYTGMLASRTFNVVWVGTSHGSGGEVTATPDLVVNYDGTAVTVSAP
jgi:alpha-D-xyloside xylohydrolase